MRWETLKVGSKLRAILHAAVWRAQPPGGVGKVHARCNRSDAMMLPGQADLPGTEPEPLRATLARKAAAPLRPDRPQEPPGGLFDNSGEQPDLFGGRRA